MKKFMKKKPFKSPSVSQSENSLNEYENIESDHDESDGVLDNLTEESDESSEEEVLAIHSGSEVDSSEDELDDESDDDADAGDDENKISDSDLDQPKNDLPDSKAWGKKSKGFYNADHINDKNEYFNEEDELAAKMEEEEARTIQKRMISEIDTADLSLDLLSDIIAERKNERDFDEKDRIVVDLSQMNQQEKIKLLKKESPKFLTFIDDYKKLMKFFEDDLLPVMKILTPRQLQNSSAGKFLKIYSQMIMNYCTNISFYVLLKSRRADAESHPIHDWISRYQQMLRKVEPIYENEIKAQIEVILSGEYNFGKISEKKRKKKSPSVDQADVEMDFDQKNDNCDVVSIGAGDSISMDNELVPNSDDEDGSGKRPITYQIAKNKGLTPHRRKELRNPRVKHRMKYRKAKIRRKGQIREVRKELHKYSGEISGIKAGVIKSIKLKN